MKLLVMLGVFLSFTYISSWAQESALDANARITVERDGSMFTIIPTYALPDTAAADTTALRYDLTVERTGASTSRSRQGGTFTPAPGRVDTLSTVRINAQPGDRLHLHLVVRRNDQIVADISRTDTISEQE
jgi:hypothetical protein